MSWSVILEDENKVVIESLDNAFSFAASNISGDFKLLKYLDPYGDTILNHLQMSDLITDLKSLAISDPDNKMVGDIIALARKCMEESHLFLSFYGD